MNGSLYKITLSALLAIATFGCASGPDVPDWKTNSARQLSVFGTSLFKDDLRSANNAFESAKNSIASTGNLELAAKLEIAKCGYLSASLNPPCNFDNKHAYFKYASEHDLAYLSFINGDWQSNSLKGLEKKYSNVVDAKGEGAREKAVLSIENPASKLIAASAVYKQQKVSILFLESVIKTSSDNGWKNPLLKWLKIALTHSEIKSNPNLLEYYTARYNLVSRSNLK